MYHRFFCCGLGESLGGGAGRKEAKGRGSFELNSTQLTLPSSLLPFSLSLCYPGTPIENPSEPRTKRTEDTLTTSTSSSDTLSSPTLRSFPFLPFSSSSLSTLLPPTSLPHLPPPYTISLSLSDPLPPLSPKIHRTPSPTSFASSSFNLLGKGTARSSPFSPYRSLFGSRFV